MEKPSLRQYGLDKTDIDALNRDYKQDGIIDDGLFEYYLKEMINTPPERFSNKQ